MAAVNDAEQIAKRLTDPLAAIVRFLASRNQEAGGSLSAPEIGRAMHARRIIRVNSQSEWARPKLNRLRTIGLAEEHGWAGNARTWTLTDLGRAVAAILHETRDVGEGSL